MILLNEADWNAVKKEIKKKHYLYYYTLIPCLPTGISFSDLNFKSVWLVSLFIFPRVFYI